MRLLAFSLAAISLSVTGAFADPVADRQHNMKERGGLMRVLAPVAQGRQDFNAATVMEALEKLNANAQAATDLDAFWPEGSNGGASDSADAVWTNRDAYQLASNQFADAVANAIAENPQDLASFQAVFAPIGAGCGACHEVYRK